MKKILQSLADSIIEKIKTGDETKIMFYHEMGLALNRFALNWGIELE
jgi:hypothetical protein